MLCGQTVTILYCMFWERWTDGNHMYFRLGQILYSSICFIFTVRTIPFKTLRNFVKRILSHDECRRNRVTTEHCNINALENIVAC